MQDSISPLLHASPDELAGAVRDAALDPRRGETDPVLVALMWETRQFMHGACALLAASLVEGRGLVPVILEGRPPGQGWMTRHVAVCEPGAAEAMVSEGRGFDAEVLDAAGGGSFRERLHLYREPGWDYRVILGLDEACGSRWMWLPNPARPSSEPDAYVSDLPALAHALGIPIDLRETLSCILSSPEAQSRPGAEDVFASGLTDWCGLEPAGPAAPWR